ncbi:ATP synthase subunit I [Extensimonas perlucida]|uniref:ATP synthase subunit I n=1 Tax=Extensimonas perlucida TaxID=2590786 RepID=UPI0011A7B4D8|nr:ATP synthase subunit I [Extensimonas perlucida]
MKKIAPKDTDEAQEQDFKPLSAQEAAQWRSRHPPVSLWSLVAGQALTGGLVALLVWLLSGNVQAGWSALYGAFAVVAPAALLVRGISRRSEAGTASAVMARFFGWELAKILVSVALLLAAPRLVPGLSWLALLVGMVITMKAYWVALWVRSSVRATN